MFSFPDLIDILHKIVSLCILVLPFIGVSKKVTHKIVECLVPQLCLLECDMNFFSPDYMASYSR
jgi:hypothetical protein